MKAKILIIGLFSICMFTSCKKNKCSECHYDKNSAEVELGEKCGDDLKTLEANGYVDNGVTYEVHCHEH